MVRQLTDFVQSSTSLALIRDAGGLAGMADRGYNLPPEVPMRARQLCLLRYPDDGIAVGP